MTIFEAQAIINRAFEAGLFEKPVPPDRADGRYAERNYRREQVAELLGVTDRIYDHVDMDQLSYGGYAPRLRGIREGHSGVDYFEDETARGQESLFFWRCALWDRVLDEVGGRFVDWEAAAGEAAEERLARKLALLGPLASEVARCDDCREMAPICCGTQSTPTPFYDAAKCLRCCPCDWERLS